MRCLGLLGGMSWESTALYYRAINQGIAARLGGLHSAPLLIWSANFAEIVALQQADDWPQAAQHLGQAGAGLRHAGAEALLLCTNTMHKIADAIADQSGLPLIHIADVTAAAIRQAGLRRVGLLATAYTMEQDFYINRLAQAGISCLVPDAPSRARVHAVIFDQLCRGIVCPTAKADYQRIIAKLQAEGAAGIILGCTEIGMLISQQDCDLPIFDTTRLHAAAAIDFVLGQDMALAQRASPDPKH